jgi:hypothetical protein
MDAKDNYERSTIGLQAAPVAETDGLTSAESAEACTAKAFPKLLPMQNEYTADKYYVRACYPMKSWWICFVRRRVWSSRERQV